MVLPGINPAMLTQLHKQTSEGLLALLNMFSGGAFSNASIFALGIMPYISASIVIQLLAIAVPYFQKIQREGESGRRQINQYTRILTIAILVFQAPSYLLNLKMQAGPSLNASLDWTFFIITSTIILAAGSMFILWLGERITNSIFVVRYCSSNFAGSRRPQSSRAICKTYCRKQTIWWCKTIYSFKGECCECNAYHLCPGNHVYPYYIGRFLKCCNRKWYCTCICRSY